MKKSPSKTLETLQQAMQLAGANWLAGRLGRRTRARSSLAKANKDLLESLPWAESIVGLAIAEKRTGNRRVKGALCLRIKVERKLPLSRLPARIRLPEALELEGLAEPVVIDVVERSQRPFEAQRFQAGPGRPVSAQFGGPGSIGMLFQHENRDYLLSAGHVLAPPGAATVGDPIEAPPSPGTAGAATLAAFLAPDRTTRELRLDCAAAELEPETITSRVRRYPDGTLVDAPVDVSFLNRHLPVWMYDHARNGWHKGSLTAIDSHEEVTVPGVQGRVMYRNQIECKIFNERGLSGSLIHLGPEDGASPPVSLHVAGNGTFSLSSPLRDVLSALEKKLRSPADGIG